MGAGARRIARARSGRVQRWLGCLRHGRWRAIVVVFVSPTLGLPPLYLSTLAAGTAGMPFGSFIVAAAVGRVLRFGSLVVLPNALAGLWRA
jgi:membrane protein YqaA with SNARE-associated domain